MRYSADEATERFFEFDWTLGPYMPIRTDGRPIIKRPMNRTVEAGRRRVLGAGDGGVDECYPGEPVRLRFGRRPDRTA